MYHPGIVLELISPSDKNVAAVDNTMQAMLRMWDENLITILVDPKFAKSIKKKDLVLVDYRPITNTSVPKLVVVKILKGALAKKIWEEYRSHFKRFRIKVGKTQTPQAPQEQYVG
ncbi:MAG: hypothetical protein V1900_03695 [Candidatus Aenigmatarchaeota archaeon]